MDSEQHHHERVGRARRPIHRRAWFIPACIGLLIGVGVAAFFVVQTFSNTTLQFEVRDKVSGFWVWDSTITLQNKVDKGFFQVGYLFTHLTRGNATLTIQAPGYVSQSIPVKLKWGRNKLPKPIEMVGYEIPDLKEFIVFEEWSANEVGIEIRPVATSGQAVVNHPDLEIRIAGVISAEMKGGAYVKASVDSGHTRGEELYRGEWTWTWDPVPETLFRYRATVPLSKIKESPAAYWVFDYVIIVPDSRTISKPEMDDLVAKVTSVTDPAKLPAIFAPYEGKVRHFTITTWNVKKGG